MANEKAAMLPMRKETLKMEIGLWKRPSLSSVV